MSTPESDEVAGHQYRLAQAARFARFCREHGTDPEAVSSGQIQLDLSPILDSRGKICPEPVDYREIKRGL